MGYEEMCCRNGSRLPPPPSRQLGFQSTYTNQPRSHPGDTSALLRPSADVPSARPPPPMDALLRTKGEVQFERTVDSLSKLFFSLVLGSFLAVCQSLSARGFQRSMYRLHPEVLPDSSRFKRANQERIEGIVCGRSLWPLPGRGRDHHDCGAGLFQHQRGAGPAADQRHPSAVYFLRRIRPICDAGQRGRVAEREPADGVGIFLNPSFHRRHKACCFLGKGEGNLGYRAPRKNEGKKAGDLLGTAISFS
jgi:hypothetical protein